LFKPSYYFCN